MRKITKILFAPFLLLFFLICGVSAVMGQAVTPTMPPSNLPPQIPFSRFNTGSDAPKQFIFGATCASPPCTVGSVTTFAGQKVISVDLASGTATWRARCYPVRFGEAYVELGSGTSTTSAAVLTTHDCDIITLYVSACSSCSLNAYVIQERRF